MVIPDYYLPDGVMELKGGLRGTINFHNSDYTRNLEMSLYGAVGGYWVDVLDQGENLSTIPQGRELLLSLLCEGDNDAVPEYRRQYLPLKTHRTSISGSFQQSWAPESLFPLCLQIKIRFPAEVFDSAGVL